MKALITSDSHGMYSQISDYILTHDDINLLIHAGDGASDVKNIHYETGINYEMVKGNNDYSSQAPYEKIIQIEGIKMFLSHGHRYNVHYGHDEILRKAKELSCDMAIFGHTHRHLNIVEDGIRIINPGSVSMPRDDKSGFYIIDIKDGSYELVRIDTNKEFPWLD